MVSKTKRWGNYVDIRNHKEYQDYLLKRYEIFLDLDWVASWDEELEEMNRGKVGAKFQFPDSMIKYQALLVEKFSSRGAEALTRQLVKFKLVPECNDHSTILRRILKLDLNFEIPKGVKIHEGTDGSGFQYTNGGDYFQDKYGKAQRKFARVIVTATKDEILAVDVVVNEKGSLTEQNAAMQHIEYIIKKGGNIEKSYNDGAFDTKDMFNFLSEHGIEPAIRIRSNASTKAKGSMARKKEVLHFKEISFKEWSKEKGYGDRWVMTEAHFSAIKRMFGEGAKAKLKENILIEHKRKVWIYNRVKQYGKI